MRDSSRFGKYALIHYKGGALGQEPFEDHTEDEPRKIQIGMDQVPRGIDEALFEMAPGETRTVVLIPEKAYGEHDPDGVQIRMRDEVPDGHELEVGAVLAWRNPITHAMLPAKVVEATRDYVKLDFNHPLAGETLEYTIEMLDIVDE